MSTLRVMNLGLLRTTLCAWGALAAASPLLACSGSGASSLADTTASAARADGASSGVSVDTSPAGAPVDVAAADAISPEPSGAPPSTESSQAASTPLDPNAPADPASGNAQTASGEDVGEPSEGDDDGRVPPDPGASDPSTDPPLVIAPPVSDTASPLPVARLGGFTTDANIIYGPLPEQRLDVLYPPTAGPNGSEKLPGVIMFHGGGWIQGDKATMASFYSRFLAHGFIVATVEYRVASQGIAPAAVEDALLAAKWLWDHADYYNIDRSKYIVTGASAGGHLALMVGMATPEANLGPTSPSDYEIAAIVNGYGPADVNDMLSRRIGFALSWLPDGTPNHDALATQVSPVTYVRRDMPPLLTVQGSNDTTVPVAEGQALHAKLLAAGVDAEHHLVAGAGHGFTTPASAWPDAEKTIFDFLVKHGIGE